MIKLLGDPVAWVYFISALVCIYGSGLFVWWWKKQRGASSVFAYVTMIFMGELLESGVSLYSRYLRIHEDPAFITLASTALWPARKTVTLLALGALVVHMSIRAFLYRDRR